MALIIEDGAGTDQNANSYHTALELRDYAELRGLENIAQLDNKKLEVLLIKAMDFLEAQRSKYKGVKTSSEQPLEWPRKEVYDVELPGALTPNDHIPRLLRYAQLALAIEAVEHDLQPNANLTGQGAVLKQKIGPIEISYSSEEPKQNFVHAFSKPAGLLSSLYKKSGLTLIRT